MMEEQSGYSKQTLDEEPAGPCVFKSVEHNIFFCKRNANGK